MIKIQPIVRDIVMKELEAYFALTNGYMNMSSYAHRIKPMVEKLTKKQVTITSLVVSLSRLRKEFKKASPLIRKVPITNITTKLPLSELSYENSKEVIGKYDKGNAIMTIISGAGGDDAEDFSAMLLNMYMKYVGKKGWGINFIHEHKNDHNGYRNVSFEVKGNPSASSGRSGPYGTLRNESGVHRLVRISPFNAKKLRHTSFSLVEVLPKFSKLEEKDVMIPEADLKIEFAKSGGPGGQNVNKRETAVRIVHIPTGISVHASGERSQEQNREQALSILRAKIFKKAEEEKKTVEESMKNTKNTEIEWGSQIRSYVLHPYKMVKDHRTNVETSNVDAALDGDLDLFVNAEKDL